MFWTNVSPSPAVDPMSLFKLYPKVFPFLFFFLAGVTGYFGYSAAFISKQLLESKKRRIRECFVAALITFVVFVAICFFTFAALDPDVNF